MNGVAYIKPSSRPRRARNLNDQESNLPPAQVTSPLASPVKRTRRPNAKKTSSDDSYRQPPTKAKYDLNRLLDKKPCLRELHLYLVSLAGSEESARDLVREWTKVYDAESLLLRKSLEQAVDSFGKAFVGHTKRRLAVGCVHYANALGIDLTTQQIADISGVSSRTASRAKFHAEQSSLDILPVEDSGNPSPFMVEHPIYVHDRKSRMKTINPSSDSHKQKYLAGWLRDNAPTKSGSLNTQSLKWPTQCQAYDAYVEHCTSQNVNHFSSVGFCRLLRQWESHLGSTTVRVP